MSRRFNPLSAAVATVTAGLIMAVGGCAMGTRSSDHTAPTSDASQPPQTEAQAEPAMPAQPAVVTGDANPPALPADQAGALPAAPPPAIAPTQPAPTAYPNSAGDNRGTAADMSSTVMNDGSGAVASGSNQPLPPRSDRN